MRTLLVLIYLLFFLILGIPYLGIMWIIGKINKPWADMAQLRTVQWGFKCILFLSGTKLNIIGEENVPKDEAVLYIGNHRSFFDIVITYSRCPRLTGYISKDVIKKIPSLRLFMKRLYCLFLVRDNPKEGMKVILKAIEYVKSGISICIFPEGTRNKERHDDTHLLPFKEGSFKIATKSGCKIVPMALTHTSDIFENHLPWIHKQNVTLMYGEPIDPASLSKEDQKKLGAYCQDVIHNMLVEITK